MIRLKCAWPACKGRGEGEILRVNPETVGITAQIVIAAQLHPKDEIYHCARCGCVWRWRFDSYRLRFDSAVLGEYGGTHSVFKFLPALWIRDAMNKWEGANAELMGIRNCKLSS